MKRIVITGAGGYIGSVLTRAFLENGYGILAVDRFFFGRETLPEESERLTVVAGDVRDFPKNLLEGTDAVIDLAAISNDPSGDLEPRHTWEINHGARVRMAKMAKEAGVKRYILPSSCSIYGFCDEIVSETSRVNPLTIYAKANFEAENEILPLADENFCAVVARQATVYGLSPRMRFDLAINGMVKGFFKNKKIPILRDGKQWRPFVHVKDIARAMRLFLEAPANLVSGEIFNVGSPEENVQIFPLAGQVAKAMGVEFEYEWYGSADRRSYRVSFDKIRSVLSFNSQHSISEAAAEIHQALSAGKLDPDDPRTITVEWYKRLIRERVLA